MKTNILFYTFIAAIGGLLFGFDTAVINGALPFFSSHFALDGTMQGVPAFAFFAMLFFVPSSPRWLVKAGRINETTYILNKLKVTDAAKLIHEIERSLTSEFGEKKENLFKGKNFIQK